MGRQPRVRALETKKLPLQVPAIARSHLDQCGVTLTEIMVSTLILAFVLIAAGYMFVLGRTNIHAYGDERTALAIGLKYMEELKGLPYYHQWLAEGTHESEAGLVVTDDRGTEAVEDDLKACVRWLIQDLDDASNGSGNVDYKHISVEIFRSQDNETCLFDDPDRQILMLSSLLAP